MRNVVSARHVLCRRATVPIHYASPHVTQRVSAAACGPAGTVHQMNKEVETALQVRCTGRKERATGVEVHRINRGGAQPPEKQRRPSGRSIGFMEEGKERGGREPKVDQQAGHPRVCGPLWVVGSHPRVCAFHVRIHGSLRAPCLHLRVCACFVLASTNMRAPCLQSTCVRVAAVASTGVRSAVASTWCASWSLTKQQQQQQPFYVISTSRTVRFTITCSVKVHSSSRCTFAVHIASLSHTSCSL